MLVQRVDVNRGRSMDVTSSGLTLRGHCSYCAVGSSKVKRVPCGQKTSSSGGMRVCRKVAIYELVALSTPRYDVCPSVQSAGDAIFRLSGPSLGLE